MAQRKREQRSALAAAYNPRDRGSMAWVIIMVVLFLMLATIIVNATVTGVQRSRMGTEAQLVTQRTESAISEAIEQMTARPDRSDPDSIPATYDAAVVDCQTVSNRSVCYQYWATPLPGQAQDPVRYNLIVHSWLDRDRDGLPPASGARSTLVPVEAISYQNASPLEPKANAGGFIEYHPTPLALFGNAIHSFTSTTLNGSSGPDASGTSQASQFDVWSYNSLTGQTGTGNAVVSTDGTVSYGARTKADRTVIFGGASGAGNFTERCTGEACGESDVRVVPDTHIAPASEEASTDWMRNASVCSAVVEGDWIASDRDGKLPAGTTCVLGNLIIDAPTVRQGAQTVLYVHGDVHINASLNVDNGVQRPGRVQVYTTGRNVSFAPTDASEQGTGIAALLYAPLATCGNNASGNYKVTYFGSLVCDTVSLSGPWEHRWDEAGAVDLLDPVPNAGKAWSVGPQQKIDQDAHHEPIGWDAPKCVVPGPTSAGGYWKFDEPTGALAKDSSGASPAKDGTWATTHRPEALCNAGASMATSGAVTYATTVPGASNTGASVEYWAKGAVGTVFEGAGLTIEHLANGHVVVTSGGVRAQVPFTVQNFAQWHLYVVTVDSTGKVMLYVDGVFKDTVNTAPIATAGSAVVIGRGSAGQIDELVYYPRVVTTDVSARWTMWNTEAAFTASVSGDPFTAPSRLIDDGTTTTAVKVAWRAASGTLNVPDATYVVKTSPTADGTYTDVAQVPLGTLAHTLTPPPVGTRYYRVCTFYNTDEKCTPALEITAVAVPGAPQVSVASKTSTTVNWSWTSVPFATSYESQWRLNGSEWHGSGGVPNSVRSHGTARTASDGPTVAGNEIELRVRAVNGAGAGPWSAVAFAQLDLPAPGASGWHFQENGPPHMYVRLVSSPGCGPGSVLQMQYQDRAVWNGGGNGYGGWSQWINQDAWGLQNGLGPASTSLIGSYDIGMNVRQNQRCVNPASGVHSAINGTHGMDELYRFSMGTNVPSGVGISIPGNRTVSATASCRPGSYPIFAWSIRGAFAADTGWSTDPGYSDGRAWGSGTATVSVVCRSNWHALNGDSPVHSATQSFG